MESLFPSTTHGFQESTQVIRLADILLLLADEFFFGGRHKHSVHNTASCSPVHPISSTAIDFSPFPKHFYNLHVSLSTRGCM